jgi:hypothetical protein
LNAPDASRHSKWPTTQSLLQHPLNPIVDVLTVPSPETAHPPGSRHAVFAEHRRLDDPGTSMGSIRGWIWGAGDANVDVCNPVPIARRKLPMGVKPRVALRTGNQPSLARTSAAER